MLDFLFFDYDTMIFYFLSVFGYLSSVQIARLVFVGIESEYSFDRTPRRVLSRLVRKRLVRRFNRKIGGSNAGSEPFIYHLTKSGYRRIRALYPSTKATIDTASNMFVAHTIAIAEIGIRLIEAQRGGLLKIVTLETEPACWRHYLTLYGDLRVLKPDLYIAIQTKEYESFAFIEVDRGTESLVTIIRKCLQYQEYFGTGNEQSKNGVFPYIVWSTESVARATAIKKAIEGEARLANGLFMVETEQDLLPRLLAD